MRTYETRLVHSVSTIEHVCLQINRGNQLRNSSIRLQGGLNCLGIVNSKKTTCRKHRGFEMFEIWKLKYLQKADVSFMWMNIFKTGLQSTAN